jgi:hypothetical protein
MNSVKSAVLDLARSYSWVLCVIVGGGLTGKSGDEERTLILGEVVGGDEAHWRAFANRATDDQLREALDLMQSLAFAA